ncbi:MarR family winged helix-turn-helix transcriptional regulator [Amycolatopsis nigrescens]|uniref:MarR family winged helix-turn-helix transcriptional regulator n=1 Tax=Amycolatopsis nigrescens TaxID=381445 RepID=UPI00036EBDF4|nr:MarR family transcriptional regulator [Amycolatopsis nigrescens]
MADAVDAVLELWRRERPDLEPALWPVGVIARIGRLSRLLDKNFKDFFAQHGLETWEIDVLTTLRRSGPPYRLTAGALLRASMVTSGAITNRIDRMESKGLVERVRDTDDRRSIRIALTPEGHRLLDEVFPLHLANEASILPALSHKEYEQLTAALRTLLEHFGDTTLD